MKLMNNLFNWSWWNEKVINVYEGYWYEWQAPRWYILVVIIAYMFFISAFCFGMFQVITTIIGQ